MGRAARRLFSGDLRHRRLQAVLLTAVVAVATAGIMAGVAQQRSAGARWDDAFRRANGAHVAVFGDADALRKVARETGVVETAGPVPLTQASVRVGGTTIDDVDVRGASSTRPAVGTPLPYSGRWLGEGADDEVVVERSFALDTGLVPGDRIAIEGAGGTAAFRVVGTYLDLLDCFYPECDSATVWVPQTAISRLDPSGAATGSLLLARLADPASVGAFEARVQDTYGAGVSHVLDWQDTRHDVLVVNQFFGVFLAAFGVFLLLAAGLVILSSVSALVLARYRELGMLKAMGFTPGSLTMVVLAENLAIALLGITLGVIAGGWLAPSLQLHFGEVLERGGTSFPPDVVVLAAVIVLAIITLATVGPAWRSGRLPASLAIARGAAPLSTRPSRLARGCTAAPARDAGNGRREGQRVPSICARGSPCSTLAVTVVAIIATLGLERTVADITANPARVGDPFDLAVDPSGASRPAIETALDDHDVAGWFTATDRRGAVGSQSFHVRVLGGNVAQSGFVVRDGHMIAQPNEAILGYGLLRDLGLHVGDRFTLDVSGGQLELRVAGWYGESEDSGKIAQITLDALRRVEPDADPGGYFVRLAEGADPAAVRDTLLAATRGVAKIEIVDSECRRSRRLSHRVPRDLGARPRGGVRQSSRHDVARYP